MLRPLLLSVSGIVGTGTDGASMVKKDGAVLCGFCGGPVGPGPAGVFAGAGRAAGCALCGLAQHLERPRIDEEALLIWLPEMSQAALHSVVRTIHCRLRALGETLHVEASPSLDLPDRYTLWYAQSALFARREALADRLLGGRPSELADALLRLPPAAYERRAKLLGGVRMLPRGRFFEGAEDIYPAIVDGWRGVAAPPSVSGSGAPRGG